MSTLKNFMIDYGRMQNAARTNGRADLARPSIEDRLVDIMRRRRAADGEDDPRRPLISPPNRLHPYGRIDRPTIEDRLIAVWRRRKVR